MWLKVSLGLAILAAVYALRMTTARPEEDFLWRQDLPVLVLFGGVLALLRLVPPLAIPRIPPLAATLAMAGFCAMAGVIGTGLVLENYPLSLDEFMAIFDAAIFRRGEPLAAIDPSWRPFVAALQPVYMLQTPDHALWASSYLPLNAVVRATASLVGAESIVNPLWTGLSVVAVYAVARRLWPERPGMALGAAALLASSAQLNLMAMTAYAMPAHLALNLTWLWLFLRGGRASHLGAIAVAFVACGLHQVIFNPLFAAPFVLQLWLDRRWAPAVAHTVAYAAIGLFWVLYWSLLFKWAGVAPAAADAVGGGWFATRVIELLAKVDVAHFGGLAENLVRFITWQNPLTVPLGVIGAAAAMKAKGTMRALALGILLTVVAMLVLVPSQTHGWGYRYLHGLLGSVCLLAIWSWARLTDELEGREKAAARTAFVAVTAAAIFVVLPLRAWQAYRSSHPYAVANAAIQANPADIVMVDDGTVGFDMGSVVRNDPYLEQGPKVMQLIALSDAQLTDLCSRFTVSVFDARNPAARGVITFRAPWASVAESRRRYLRTINCGN